jgi:hypothetical protein
MLLNANRGLIPASIETISPLNPVQVEEKRKIERYITRLPCLGNSELCINPSDLNFPLNAWKSKRTSSNPCMFRVVSDVKEKQQSNISNEKPSEGSSRSDSQQERIRTVDRAKRPRKLPSMPEAISIPDSPIRGVLHEPRPLLHCRNGTRLVCPRNGRRSRLPTRAGEVLKPLDPSTDDSFDLSDDLAVVGLAITTFGDGWDLPPGVCGDAASQASPSDEDDASL